MSAIQKLATTFPAPSTMGEADDVLAELEAVTDGFAIEDVEGGIRLILGGRLKGYEGRFLPTAPQLARAIRQALGERAESEARDRPPRLMPPVPVIERDDASRARVRALAERFVGQQQASLAAAELDGEERMAALTERTRKRFALPDDPQSVQDRLLGNRMNSGVVR